MILEGKGSVEVLAGGLNQVTRWEQTGSKESLDERESRKDRRDIGSIIEMSSETES